MNRDQKESLHVGGEDAVDEVQLWEVEGAVELVIVERHIS